MSKKQTKAWPTVAVNDDGIRPAGGPGECYYCGEMVGQPHGRECVVVKKRVKVRYSFTIEVDIPHFWDKDDFEFHRNEGSWCANNAIAEIQAMIPTETIESPLGNVEMGPCLCPRFEAKFLKTIDATPRREVIERPPQEGKQHYGPCAHCRGTGLVKESQ